jgi:thiamine kinase-like enzyme
MPYDILYKKYGNIELKELNGGYTNKVILLNGSNPQVIAKIFKKGQYNDNHSVQNEINALLLLEKVKISPKLYDYFEDNNYVYIIMDYINGINGQTFLDKNDIDKVKIIYRLLGFHLAKDIHSIKYEKTGKKLSVLKLENINNNTLEFVPIKLKEKIKDILNINVTEEYTLIHGDFGPHNIIYSNDNIVAIDWEWAGWGNPLQDIAWVVWFVHLHYPNLCNELSNIFLKAYYSNKTIQITEETIKAFLVNKIINILRLIKTEDNDAKNEWNKRLEWTIEHNFIGNIEV